MDMAIYTAYLNLVMDILGPFCRINLQRPNFPLVCDLEKIRFPMTLETFLIRKGLILGKGLIKNKEEDDE